MLANASTFQFPSEMAPIIENRWRSIIDHPLPDTEILETLLNTCFFASLQLEEDRHTMFDLTLAHKAHLTQNCHRYSNFAFIYRPFLFNTPRAFTVQEIMRLAPSCDPDKTRILAQINDDESLSISGIVDVGKDSHAGHEELGILRIKVLGLGEIEVFLKDSSICSYRAGKINQPDIGLITRGPVYERLKETSIELVKEAKLKAGVVDWDIAVHERDPHALSYFLAFDKLMNLVRRQGHGGSILIVPNLETPISDILDIKYKCQDTQTAIWTALKGSAIIAFTKDRLDERFNSISEMELPLYLKEKDVEQALDESLEALARLTSVDGAVVVTQKFELIGFGAVVKMAANSDFRVLRALDREAEVCTTLSVESYGTRHRSAFQFCDAIEDSIAFVASQDGRSKMVTGNSDNVLVWEGLSFSVANEQTKI